MADTSHSFASAGSLSAVIAITRVTLERQLGLRCAVSIGAAMEVGATGLGIVSPYALKLLVDALTNRSTSLEPISAIVALFVFSWAGGTLFGIWRVTYTTRVIDRLTQTLITRALQEQLPLSASRRDGRSGHLQGLMERLPYALTIVVDGLVWRGVPLAIQVVGTLLVIAAVTPMTNAFLLLLVLTLYGVAAWVGAVRHQRHAVAANHAAGVASADLGDILRNARRVVFNGAVDVEMRLIQSRFQEKTRANHRMMSSFVHASVLQYGTLAVGLTVIFASAAYDCLSGRVSVSDFVLLQTYAFRLVIPLAGFGFMISQTASAIDTVGQVLALTGRSPQAQGPKQGRPPTGPAKISLENVGFRYGEQGAGLGGISAVIAPGAFVVIVGPNGSGKSTLAQVIAGLLAPSTGMVTVAGSDIHKLRPEDRHKFVLYVPQSISLFNRPLRDNALYPPTGQTETGITTLLAKWGFQGPGQSIDLSRVAGEGGERLSGGQLQKLELARLGGIKVPALILDESTSALDPTSEAAIIGDLRQKLRRWTTLVVVTHRLGLAQAADQVLFIESGRLVGQGNHDHLSVANPAYQHFWSDEKQRS